MRGFKLLALTLATLAMPASAALVGDFQLNGSTANAVAGPLTLTNNGATLGGSGLTFAANNGPTITGFSSPSDYTVETWFRFNNVNGYRKIADFYSRSSDNGLYVLSGNLNFYPVVTGSTSFAANQLISVVFTRDATNQFTGYVNGTAQFTFSDAGNLAAIGTDLELFRDDFATGQGEASGGFVDYVRVYDTALTAGEVAALGFPGGVPEPAAWALMIGGFGLVGAASRRRRLAMA